jgi:hypothetical protein
MDGFLSNEALEEMLIQVGQYFFPGKVWYMHARDSFRVPAYRKTVYGLRWEGMGYTMVSRRPFTITSDYYSKDIKVDLVVERLQVDTCLLTEPYTFDVGFRGLMGGGVENPTEARLVVTNNTPQEFYAHVELKLLFVSNDILFSVYRPIVEAWMKFFCKQLGITLPGVKP